jgi:hypothetical protein
MAAAAKGNPYSARLQDVDDGDISVAIVGFTKKYLGFKDALAFAFEKVPLCQ